MKHLLADQVECIESESKCLQSFRDELEQLGAERQAHLDELRQIDADILMVRDTRFQAQQIEKTIREETKNNDNDNNNNKQKN